MSTIYKILENLIKGRKGKASDAIIDQLMREKEGSTPNPTNIKKTRGH